MASPSMPLNTSSFSPPRVNPLRDGAEAVGEIEERAEREWIAAMRRGHETWIRPPATEPPYEHPTNKGYISDTRLWPGRKR